MSRVLPCIRAATALAAIAAVASGCAAANNATSAQAQGEQPYKTMYGVTNEGTTTDLYTELFGSSQAQPSPTANVAAAPPAQPVTPVQPNAAAPAQARSGRTATASHTPPQPAPQPAPVQVAQQPATPPEPDVPTAFGIPANGPTTDLYTAIFGPRRSDGQ